SRLVERVPLLWPGREGDGGARGGLRAPLEPPSSEVPTALPASADIDEATSIRDALGRAGGNVVRAARILGIGRNALRHRMRRHGIERPTDDDLASAPATRRRKAETPRAGRPSPPPASVEPSWEQKVIAVLAIDMVFPASPPEPWTVARQWQPRLAHPIAAFAA